MLYKLWRHFSIKRKKQFIVILFLMITASFAELLSLGAILPFLGVLANPDKAISYFENLPFGLHDFLIHKDTSWLVVFITTIFIVCAVFSGLVRFLCQYALIRFSHSIGADFSAQIVRLTLYQPYIIHCSKNSSEFLNMVTVRVNEAVYAVLVPTLTLFSSIFLAIAILTGLFVIQPYVALGSLLGFGSIYILISIFSQRKLSEYGKVMHTESNRLFKVLQETSGGIKDIIINGTQSNFLDYYLQVDIPLRRSRSSAQFISAAPKYGLEVAGMILIALIALYLSDRSQGMYGAIPVIGAMALGAQKLLPIMQTCFFSWSQIQTFGNSLPHVIRMLDQPNNESLIDISGGCIQFSKEIRFERVSFKYFDQQPYVLNDGSLLIAKGSRVGVVGSSGSGKSTLADLLMGLLTPNKGSIYIDDEELNKQNLRSFQNLIAHVPQDIFLADASIAENIAFGIPYEKINFDLVREAALSAHLIEVESWPDGYRTSVGERGVLLSGGQRQRIGIARALYKKAEIIIFDEATSALDTVTESIVIEAINSLPKDITLVLIAHRLSTLEKCSKILEVIDGRVVQYDGFNEYISNSKNKSKH